MGKTSIEWTDRTANPIRARHRITGKVGWHCVKHSPGCAHCYAETINGRFGTRLPFTKHSTDQVEIFVDPRPMQALARMKQGWKVFMCDMTDLFMDGVTDEQLDVVFAWMALCRQHTFQVLTKRADRLEDYVMHRRSPLGFKTPELVASQIDRIAAEHGWPTRGYQVIGDDHEWLPRNIWLGVSVEDQKRADERIPHLLKIPAAVRFLSIEPLLGPVVLESYFAAWCADADPSSPGIDSPGLDWVIVGGESGHGARPMHLKWATDLRDQCAIGGARFFFKQWGEWVPDGQSMAWLSDVIGGRGAHEVRIIDAKGRDITDNHGELMPEYPSCVLRRRGKKNSGRLLDGREWNEMPTAAGVLV